MESLLDGPEGFNTTGPRRGVAEPLTAPGEQSGSYEGRRPGGEGVETALRARGRARLSEATKAERPADLDARRARRARPRATS
jgi:hypothetical protein